MTIVRHKITFGCDKIYDGVSWCWKLAIIDSQTYFDSPILDKHSTILAIFRNFLVTSHMVKYASFNVFGVSHFI